ncbi:MAG: indolepyruvate oxidoreductase subunit beta [Clostridiales bacterium]|nr:indolepyruvate oxidoreductase subunit beta [Clostridiales bacterium]
MDKTTENVIVAGVGGQGTVLAGRLIAEAAMQEGLSVKGAETIGMAQRGGSVTSFIRFGGECATPFIKKGEADLILGFEPGECVRLLPYLGDGGAAVVLDRAVMPVSALTGASRYEPSEMISYLKNRVGRLVLVDAESAARALGTSKCLNVALLGAAARSGALGLTVERLASAVKAVIPPRLTEINLKALNTVTL